MNQVTAAEPGKTSRAATAGYALAWLALLLMIAGFYGLSSQKLAQGPSFKMFLGGIPLALIALAISMLGWRRSLGSHGRKRALSGIVISLAIIIPMSPYIFAAFTVPPIHDITTDTDNPPLFVDILPLRAAAPNSAEYGGAALAAMQKAAFADIAPLQLAVPAAEAFTRAENLVRARGWAVAASVPARGRIEATAETEMMRFRDDVVIRITASDTGSKIDMRSVSRFGQSDLGVNAKRIRDFLRDLNAGP